MTPTAMTAAAADAAAALNVLAAAYAADPAAFFAAPVAVRHAVRGGDPEGYTSEVIEVTLAPRPNAAPAGEVRYYRSKYDAAYDPPFLVEQFTLPAGRADAEAVVKPLLSGDLLKKPYPAEADPQVAGLLKETWSVNRDGAETAKTFFEPFPKEFQAVRAATRDLIERAVKGGKRAVLSTKAK
jgi:hypothetical protein